MSYQTAQQRSYSGRQQKIVKQQKTVKLTWGQTNWSYPTADDDLWPWGEQK